MMESQTTRIAGQNSSRQKPARRIATRTLSMIAMLAVLGFVLKLLEIPFPLIPPWLKFDFGDLPSLLGTFALGPVAGIGIVFIKEVLFFFIHGSATGGVGELANFILGSSFVITAGLIYRRFHNRKGALLGLLAGIAVFTMMGVVANIYILMPVYSTFFPFEAMVGAAHAVNPAINSVNDIVWMGVLPFNIIKGILTATATFLMYKYVSPFLKKQKQG